MSREGEVVVLVHGLWMTGLELVPLQRRLERCGFACRRFRYASVRRPVRENARRLAAFLRGLEARRVHFVTHSLGGLVVYQLFDLAPIQAPGRIVMLAPPLAGSRAAGKLWRWRLGRRLLGRSFEGGLDGRLPRWHGSRVLGVVAGTRPVGAGSLLLRALEPPNDGVVEVREACPEWVQHCCLLPHTHFTLLFAADAAAAVCDFLWHGRFTGDARQAVQSRR